MAIKTINMDRKAVEAKVKDVEEKSIFRQAGEVIGSIAAHIVNAKDRVMDLVSNEVVVAKKTAKKVPIKRTAKKVAKKKTVSKSSVKKATKKSTTAKRK